MKLLVCIWAFLLMGGTSWADSGLLGGLNYTQYKAEVGGMEFKDTPGVDLGYQLLVDLGLPIFLRTGAELSYRSTTLNAGPLEIEIDDFYGVVPVTAFYDFTERFSGFAGFNLLFHLAGFCDSNATSDCDYTTGAQGIVLALTAGANVAIIGNSALEVVYENTLGNVYSSVTMSSLGLRYLYQFD